MDEAGDMIMFDKPAAAERNFERNPNGPGLIPIIDPSARIRFVDRASSDLEPAGLITVKRPDRVPPDLSECKKYLKPRELRRIYAIQDPQTVSPKEIGKEFVFVLPIFRLKE